MTILIADDHPLMCEALKKLVAELSADLAVLDAGSLEKARAALAASGKVKLVVLELALDGAPALSALEAMQSAAGDTPIVVLTARDDPATARAVLESGARGFLSKRSPRRVVLEALRLVLFGGTYVPPEALQDDIPALARETAARTVPSRTPRGDDPLSALGLTPRQIDVLALLVQGNSTKEICRALNLAEGTIKVHTQGPHHRDPARPECGEPHPGDLRAHAARDQPLVARLDAPGAFAAAVAPGARERRTGPAAALHGERVRDALNRAPEGVRAAVK